MTDQQHDLTYQRAQRASRPSIASRPERFLAASDAGYTPHPGQRSLAPSTSSLNATLRGPLGALALPIGAALLADGLVI